MAPSERSRSGPADLPRPAADGLLESRTAGTSGAEGSRSEAGFGAGRRAERADRLVSLAVPIALVCIVAVFSVLKPATFFTLNNLQTVLTGQATVLVVALGLTVVLATGGLDLSVGGAIGFAGVVFGYTTTTLHLTWPLGIVIALAAAVAIGLANASLIVAIKANSLIVTLAMGTLLDGVSAAITNSQTIGGLPAGMQSLITYRVLGIGAAFWYGVVITVILWYVLHHMRGGRYVYFTGEGREAASLAGIRVNMVRTVALVVSALGACLGGLIMAGQTGAVQAGVGDPFLLPAFAAVFLGASTIKVGRFNPIGTFLAVILLAVGSDGLQLFGLNTWVTQVYDAAILITAVGFVALARKTT
jgi:ribose transport system permease protein